MIKCYFVYFGILCLIEQIFIQRIHTCTSNTWNEEWPRERKKNGIEWNKFDRRGKIESMNVCLPFDEFIHWRSFSSQSRIWWKVKRENKPYISESITTEKDWSSETHVYRYLGKIEIQWRKLKINCFCFSDFFNWMVVVFV